MLPLPHGVASLWTGLKHDRRHAAFEDVRGSGEADGAGSDNGYLLRSAHLHSPMKLEISKFEVR